MSFKDPKNVKPKSLYQRIVAKGDQLRQKPPKKYIHQAKTQITRNLQRFSGKKGN